MKKGFVVAFSLAVVILMLMPASMFSAADVTRNGNIVDGDGVGIAGITVNVYEADDAENPYVSDITDADGLFSLDIDDSVEYLMEVVSDEYVVSLCNLGAPDETGRYTIAAGSAVNIFIVMLPRDVDVTITVSGGGKVSGIGITVTDISDPDDVRNDITDPNGSVTFTGSEGPDRSLDRSKRYYVDFDVSTMPAGYGILYANDLELIGDRYVMGFSGSTKTAETFDVFISLKYMAVSGYVTNSDGNPLGDVSITFRSKSSGATVEVKTNSRGFYEYRTNGGLLIGTYEVTVTRSGYETMAKDVTVTEEGNSDGHNSFDFTMESVDNTYLFGLDLPHSFMFIAGIIGAFLIVVVIVYRYRIGRKRDAMESSLDMDPEGGVYHSVHDDDDRKDE